MFWNGCYYNGLRTMVCPGDWMQNPVSHTVYEQWTSTSWGWGCQVGLMADSETWDLSVVWGKLAPIPMHSKHAEKESRKNRESWHAKGASDERKTGSRKGRAQKWKTSPEQAWWSLDRSQSWSCQYTWSCCATSMFSWWLPPQKEGLPLIWKKAICKWINADWALRY